MVEVSKCVEKTTSLRLEKAKSGSSASGRRKKNRGYFKAR